jgi:hypothetical protein
MWTILAWICAAAISVVSLRYLATPYLWVFLTAAVALFVTAAIDKNRRALWYNVAFLAIGLAIFEQYLWTSSIRGIAARQTDEGNVAKRIHAPHAQLGWAPQAGTTANQKVSYEGELLYDATYNIGPNGLRISSRSASDPDPSAKCVLFFGGSFMFGQGLEDHQTLPFLVHEQSSGQYYTYNFGVKGYGAHQMLAALQYGLVLDAVQCGRTQVTHVFYQGITDHIRRAAGRLWWNIRGPKYVLDQDGGVSLNGRFEDNDDYAEDRTLLDLLGTQIFKSMIYQQIVQGTYLHKHSQEELDLYLGIVDEAGNAVRAEFPAAAFHVLWWDDGSLDNQAVSQGLEERDITVHLMSDILPSYRPDEFNEMYRLHETDPHPNALANELLAQYLLDEVLGPPRLERDVNSAAPDSGSTNLRLRS